MKLRDYQNDAVDAAIEYMRGGGRCGLISMATGTGKSVVIAELIRRVMTARPDIGVTVATHVSELVEQNYKKLKQIWQDAPAGVYSSGLGIWDKKQITFCGIQSVFSKDWYKTHLLIIDECHTISRKDKSMWASFIGRLKDINPNMIIIGLSATTFRLDSGNLCSGEDAMFESIVYEYGLSKAISDGYLCNLVGKKTATEYDISGVGKQGGEFKLKDLEAATNLDHLTAAAVREVVEKWGTGRKSWLAFCNGIAHSFAVRDEIRKYGISCETVTGETPDNERVDILERFKNGSLTAVTNNAVWTTGVDVPNVDMIIMLRHTMSGGLLLQMAGRGTRVMTDINLPTPKERRDAIKSSVKPNCLFLDFAGNIQRHGFLDQITGKDKKKGEGVAPMKFCPDCSSICHAAATFCKDCGFKFQVIEKEAVGKLHDGDVFSNNAPIEKEVLGVSFMATVPKEGKISTLKVRYKHPDNDATTEWLGFQHTGRYHKTAIEWLKLHAPLKSWDYTKTIKQAVEEGFFDDLKWPTKITVRKEGDFWKPIKRDFSTILDNHDVANLASYSRNDALVNTLAEMDDIAF